MAACCGEWRGGSRGGTSSPRNAAVTAYQLVSAALRFRPWHESDEDDDENTTGVRLAAARYVLDAALRWRDQTEVERRLAALEAATAQQRRPWEVA